MTEEFVKQTSRSHSEQVKVLSFRDAEELCKKTLLESVLTVKQQLDEYKKQFVVESTIPVDLLIQRILTFFVKPNECTNPIGETISFDQSLKDTIIAHSIRMQEMINRLDTVSTDLQQLSIFEVSDEEDESESTTSTNSSSVLSEPVKRGRGRPRKITTE